MNEIKTINNNSEKNNSEMEQKEIKLSQQKKDYLNEILYFSINQESK
jgi:hypothetical protein